MHDFFQIENPKNVRNLPGPTDIKVEGKTNNDLRCPSPIPCADAPLNIHAVSLINLIQRIMAKYPSKVFNKIPEAEL